MVMVLMLLLFVMWNGVILNGVVLHGYGTDVDDDVCDAEWDDALWR